MLQQDFLSEKKIFSSSICSIYNFSHNIYYDYKDTNCSSGPNLTKKIKLIKTYLLIFVNFSTATWKL